MVEENIRLEHGNAMYFTSRNIYIATCYLECIFEGVETVGFDMVCIAGLCTDYLIFHMRRSLET